MAGITVRNTAQPAVTDVCSLNGEDVRLMLWDTAGQEEFDCITRAYYRYTSAGLQSTVTQL